MTFALHVDPAAALPIWRQIEEGVLHAVATGAAAPRDAVPSVRDLALRLRVNPATVAKAYQRLVDAGVLEVRRGEGTFVAAAPPAMSDGQMARRLQAGAVRLASLARSLGATRGEAIDALREAWNEIDKERER
jgi:GntR family transcriptional regulator